MGSRVPEEGRLGRERRGPTMVRPADPEYGVT